MLGLWPALHNFILIGTVRQVKTVNIHTVHVQKVMTSLCVHSMHMK